jgi:hypothetical protein
MQYAARPKLFAELRGLGIVGVLRFLFGIGVVEVAQEFVESVNARKKFIPVAEMVFADLTGGIAKGLEHVCNGGVLEAQANIRPREPDFG